MTLDAEAVRALACSRCAGALESSPEGGGDLRCRDCARSFPVLDGLPCLMPEPAQFRLEWLGRLEAYLEMIDAAEQGIATEQSRDDLAVRTRERLIRLASGMQLMRREVDRLMAPVVNGVNALPLPAFPDRAGPQAAMAILHHYENVFRDWAWGHAECARQAALLERLFPAEPVRRLAIYGSGAGRLAAELHARLRPAQTFALDVNPLPLIVAHELTRGNPVELTELPVAPRTEEQVAVRHLLEAPRARAGLTYLLADALAPPFAPRSLDVVVTPWFIDVAGVDVAVTARAIHRVLRPGGLWLNIGPLLFRGAISEQHAIGETLDLVRDGGFALLSSGSDVAPYFQSPHSASWRVETQYWFSAERGEDSTPLVTARDPPAKAPWLLDVRLPIPALPELAANHRASLFTAGVLAMVDGRRSIADLAATLAAAWNAEPSAVEDHLRTFFGGFFSTLPAGAP